MNNQPRSGVAPVKMILDWEGAALVGATTPNGQSAEGTLASAGHWVAANVTTAVVGNSVYDALKGKIVAFLANWRTQNGGRKLDDLKQQVLAEIEKQHPDPRQGEALRQTVDELFQRAVHHE